MKADGITLSTVGAGGGANPFLEQLATQGGGRFYAAANPASIPDIFLKETQQVSGQQIIEEPFFPIQTSSSPILRGLDQGLPKLLGYNGTTAKPAAQTVLVTSRDDPLLAQWQYGLGRSVAWTSDSTGRWAKDWLAWPGFDKFFSQLVSWTFPGDETDGIEATFQTKDGRTSLHIESVEADGSPRDFYATHAVLVGPDLEPHDVALSQVAPGEYEATLGEVDPGAYAIRVTQTKPGSSPLGRTVGLVAPTSAEYRLLGTDEAFLGSLRAATGGTVITTALQPWTHDLTVTSHFTDLWPLLLILALLLWPLDIALRRVSVGRRELALARGWVRGIGGTTASDGTADVDRGEPAGGAGAGDRGAVARVAARSRDRDGRADESRAPSAPAATTPTASAARRRRHHRSPPPRRRRRSEADPTAAPPPPPPSAPAPPAEAHRHAHQASRREARQGPLTFGHGPRRTGSATGDTFPAMSPIRLAVAALLMSALVAGCGVVSTTPPVPQPRPTSPTSPTACRASAIRIDHVVSGDAGCSDQELIPTAIGFDASGLDQASVVRLHLFIFRNHDVVREAARDGRRLRGRLRHRPADLRVDRRVAVRRRVAGPVGPAVRGGTPVRAQGRRRRRRGRRRRLRGVLARRPSRCGPDGPCDVRSAPVRCRRRRPS